MDVENPRLVAASRRIAFHLAALHARIALTVRPAVSGGKCGGVLLFVFLTWLTRDREGGGLGRNASIGWIRCHQNRRGQPYVTLRCLGG